MTGRQPNWQLILKAAEALTASDQVPFTRVSVYEWIWRRYPRGDHDRPSLDPTFQGMIGNAPGGPPSPCGTPLHRTGRGQYILARSRQGNRAGAAALAGRGTVSRPAGHAFISYVREDSVQVDRLQEFLEDAGIPVWRDVAHLWPGQDWRAQIRNAITGDALAFLACFSQASVKRARSYQNEELNEAVGQVRQRPQDLTWLIPVRFDDCQIPGIALGSGRNLQDLHCADLFGPRYHEQAERLIQAIRGILHGTKPYVPREPAPDRRSAREIPPEPLARRDAGKQAGFYGVRPDPAMITVSVVIEPAGRGNYDSETGSRVVMTPIYSPYPLSYGFESRYGDSPKLFLLVGVPDEACRVGSIIHTRHVNGTKTATIDWQVVHPRTARRNLPRWQVKAVETRPH